MAYSAINLVTFLVGVVFVLNGYRLVRQNREDVAMFLLSGVIGLGLITAAAVPGLFDTLGRVLGIDVRATVIFDIAILTLFVIVTYLFSRISRLYTQVSELNEELTLLRRQLDERDDE